MVRYYSFFIYLNMQLSTPCLGSLFLRTHFHFYFEDVSIVHLSYFRLLLFLIFPQTHLLFLFKMSNYYPPYLFQSPLHLAAVSPHGGMCLEILLSEGADVNIRCKDGRMPLHMIASARQGLQHLVVKVSERAGKGGRAAAQKQRSTCRVGPLACEGDGQREGQSSGRSAAHQDRWPDPGGAP